MLGIISALFVQLMLLTMVTLFTNWEKEVSTKTVLAILCYLLQINLEAPSNLGFFLQAKKAGARFDSLSEIPT